MTGDPELDKAKRDMPGEILVEVTLAPATMDGAIDDVLAACARNPHLPALAGHPVELARACAMFGFIAGAMWGSLGGRPVARWPR